MALRLSRRAFLSRGTLAAGLLATGYHVHPRPARASISTLEKLNLAAIGTGNRAAANIRSCASQNIVALADIDAHFLGAAGETYRQARRYRDYREMLEREDDKVDAVIVATPDHTHAPAAAMAMHMGKHTYCEKPLTHTVYEARKLAELAAAKKLVTQMGTQIHAGENYRRVVELIECGTIGEIRECHVWVGVNYTGGKLLTASKPSHVDWDLWLGPAGAREYVESTISGLRQTVHPIHWRWFWDYGSGGLGDFGCHYMDLAHWALKLQHPTSISAAGPEPDNEATTAGLIVKYTYPARGELPPVELTWYDGGKKPPMLASLHGPDGEPLNWASGQLFIGQHGAVISDYSRHLLLPFDRTVDLVRPEPYIAPSLGHHDEWIDAIKNNGQTTCNYTYSGALTEAVLLGVASYRSGEPLEWNAEQLRVTNSSTSQRWIHKEYRRGWTLDE